MSRAINRYLPSLILFAGSLLLTFWLRTFLDHSEVVSVDLSGHQAAIEKLIPHLSEFRLFFYDPWWFAGWPAYQFYGFFSHLVTAILSMGLSLWFDSPVRLSMQVILLLGSALLPFSVYHLSRIIYEGKSRSDNYEAKAIIAINAVAFTFWYLSLPYDFYGIGAASLWHGGFFNQIFAWHFMLLFFSVLLEDRQHTNSFLIKGSILFSLIILTHIFTAVFVIAIWLPLLIKLKSLRMVSFKTMILSLMLTAFWWLPMQRTVSLYTIPHTEPPLGNLGEIFVEKPFLEVARSAKELITNQFIAVDIFPVIILLLIISTLIYRNFWKHRFNIALYTICAFSFSIFSNKAIADALPLGLHYYRFISFNLLFGVAFISSFAPVLFPKGVLRIYSVALFASFALLTIQVLDREISFPLIVEEKTELFQKMVLRKLEQDPVQGRVAFEYFKDRRIFPFLSPHYLESRLAQTTKRETTNGLFIQSSLSSTFVSQSLKSLGLQAYRVPPLWQSEALLSKEVALEQLSSYGVSTLVVTSAEEARALVKSGASFVSQIGPYIILNLNLPVQEKLQVINKQLVFYHDTIGNVPFKFIESYFYADPDLYKKTFLIELPHASVPLPEGALLLTNKSGSDLSFYLDAKVSFSGQKREQEFYQRLKALLDSSIREKLLAKLNAQPVKASTPSASLNLNEKHQAIYIDHVVPGSFYETQYSYFPYWTSEHGDIYRGIGEKMVIVPRSDAMTLTYNRFSDTFVVASSGASLAALCILIGICLMQMRTEYES